MTAKLVVFGVILARKSGVLDVGDNAENWPVWTSKRSHTLSDRVLVREEAPRERFTDENDVLRAVAIVFGEYSAGHDWDAQNGEVIRGNQAMDDHAACR